MNDRSNAIVAAYLDGMKARYAWAQGDTPVARKGLEAGAFAARNACAGKIKLEGEAWTEAVRKAGYVGPMTKAGIAAFCSGED